MYAEVSHNYAPALRPVSGHDVPEEVVGRCSTMPRDKITLFKPAVHEGTNMGQPFYAGKLDFGAGGLTDDGRMIIKQSFRAMLLLYTRKFGSSITDERGFCFCSGNPSMVSLPK